MTIDTVKIFKNEQNKHALVSKKLEKRPVKTGEDRPVWKVRPDRTGPAGPVPVYRSGSKSDSDLGPDPTKDKFLDLVPDSGREPTITKLLDPDSDPDPVGLGSGPGSGRTRSSLVYT